MIQRTEQIAPTGATTPAYLHSIPISDLRSRNRERCVVALHHQVHRVADPLAPPARRRLKHPLDLGEDGELGVEPLGGGVGGGWVGLALGGWIQAILSTSFDCSLEADQTLQATPKDPSLTCSTTPPG
jgi:hypothetical protein